MAYVALGVDYRLQCRSAILGETVKLTLIRYITCKHPLQVNRAWSTQILNYYIFPRTYNKIIIVLYPIPIMIILLPVKKWVDLVVASHGWEKIITRVSNKSGSEWLKMVMFDPLSLRIGVYLFLPSEAATLFYCGHDGWLF